MKKLIFLLAVGLCSTGMSIFSGQKMATDRYHANLLLDYVMRCALVFQTHHAYGNSPAKDDRQCPAILNEVLPVLLREKGDVLVTSFDKETEATEITATQIPEEIGATLKERMGKGSIAGVSFNFDKKTKKGVFLFKKGW